MTKEKALKLQAKNHLSGNRPAAVGATLTVFVALMTSIYLPTIIFAIAYQTTALQIPLLPDMSVLILLFAFFICISAILPLITGYIRFCYVLTKYNYCDYSQVFFYYSKGKFFSSVKICYAIILRSLWQAVVSFIPGIQFLVISTQWSSLPIVSELTETLTAHFGDGLLDFTSIICYYIVYALLFAGLMLFFILTKHNFLAIYLFIEYDHLKASDICRSSATASARFGKDIIKLNFSLLPMMLLCVLIIPAIFVLPYISVTKATAAKWMIALSYKNEA